MKLSNLIQRQENLILNGNDNNKLSNYVKTKEIVTQADNESSVFNMVNNFRLIKRDKNFYGDGRDGDLFTTGNVSFPSTTDGDTVYKYFNNLTINEGHTVTTSHRCKGLVIYCRGDCIINGILSMTARGCRGIGEHFKPNNLDKLNTPDGVIDMSIGAVGGTGGARVRARTTQDLTYQYATGNTGNIGIDGACGGGGSGGAGSGHSGGDAYSGAGSQGTTWSGGSGGGGCSVAHVYRIAQAGAINGGAGGNANSGSTNTSGAPRCASGGSGNNGGARSNSGCTGYAGLNGTGGLLILIVKGNLTINGIISSNGINGGSGGQIGGGGSGGGTVTILYKNIFNNGSIQANGGSGGIGSQRYGGAGGAGSIRIQRIL